MAENIKHPATFSRAVLEVIQDRLPKTGRILDPFAGIGGLATIETGCELYFNELEPEWANQIPAEHQPRVTIGDARCLKYPDGYFDGICTSPCYGNRLADHHNARDGSHRITYRHYLGRPLSEGSAAGMQWGDAYKEFHRAAWAECYRVLRPGGYFFLNVSDHIRGGKIINASGWHKTTVFEMGYWLLDQFPIPTPRMRRGANYNLRVEHEWLFVFLKLGA